MKRAAITIAVLAMCAGSWAQGNDKPATQTPAAGQTGQAATTPPGKRPPQAKTQAEFQAYKDAIALPDGAAAEKAADDFAAKYPDSELRVVLYKSAMRKYQQVNNGEKMLEMARKALTYDADDPEALLGVSQALLEGTHDADLDRDQKLAECKKDAEHALGTIDTDIPTTGYPPEQLEAFKGYTRSEAYIILGTLAFNAKSWPDAETNLRKSIEVFPQQPDPIAVFRLAVALDMQNKIPEAMKYDDQAVDLTKDHPDSGVGKAARDEKDRLVKLNGGTAPGQTPTPPKN
ncbi:MAG TPA: tetratricopeptide repeat protein [Verrucomicrobiae bacterium]|nr:tetratricopeptide repeat protein [Verrucomicrobiae bacterium]